MKKAKPQCEDKAHTCRVLFKHCAFAYRCIYSMEKNQYTTSGKYSKLGICEKGITEELESCRECKARSRCASVFKCWIAENMRRR